MAISQKNFFLPLSLILLKLLTTAFGQGTTNLSTVLGEKQYYIGLTQKVNWYRAAQICSALGMSLASIESDTEQTNLKSYLFTNSALSDQFWLSGSDLALYKDFTWISTGNRFSYNNWAPSQPNGGIKKRCVQTDAKFEWMTDACESVHYFICSRPVIPECGATGRCSFNYNLSN